MRSFPPDPHQTIHTPLHRLRISGFPQPNEPATKGRIVVVPKGAPSSADEGAAEIWALLSDARAYWPGAG